MSNFLHNLIARSHGLKSVAQPRLASRFEPLPGSIRPVQGPTFALESEEHTTGRAKPSATPVPESGAEPSFGEAVTEEAAPRATTTTGAGQPGARPFKTEWRPAEAGQTLNQAGSSPLDASSSSASGARLSAQHRQSDLQAAADRAAHDRDIQRTESDLDFNARKAAEFLLKQRAQLEREAGATVQSSQFSTTGRGHEEHLARGDEHLTSAASSSEQGEAELARRAVVPVRTSAQSKENAENAGPVSAASRSGVEVESLSPTIRVTIGRIDVRAVMPEAGAAQRRAAAAPARPTHGPLSLEEYLKQRNGGRR